MGSLSTSTTSLQGQAQVFVTNLAAQCTNNTGFGSMSPSIYDTAWVSLVQKTGNGHGNWLFPQCFDFILSKQLPSGGWESYASTVDGILNTAAGLLALKRHMKTETANSELHKDWLVRSQKAEVFLNQALRSWNPGLEDQVGFEVLIIQHISLLEKEGVYIDFPQLDQLRVLHDAKLAKMPPELLYRGPSTLYHSLEALIGYIDFDQIRHWRDSNGSMMGSPSSTAAYLIHATVWDDESEAYLCRVLQMGSGRGNGSVPSAWPTTVFELTWASTTLLEAGIPFGDQESRVIHNFLWTALADRQGLLGFSPGYYPDADDTAKAITTIHYLSRSTNTDHYINSLISTFSASEHFQTYPGERNASFSANCNVLVCLLTLPTSQHVVYASQIAKATLYLTSQVFNGQVRDKWHLRDLYWMMLLAHAYTLLYQNESLLHVVFDLEPNLCNEIPMVALRLLIWIISKQQANGSWEDVCEVTSYAVLALSSLSRLPWIQALENSNQILAAVVSAKSFLQSHREAWSRGHYLWIEKVNYASDILSEAYCLAASLVCMPEFSTRVEPPRLSSSAYRIPDKIAFGMRKAGELISRTPIFAEIRPFIMRAAEMQACYAFLALQAGRQQDIFPRTAKGEDKYLIMIPLTFTACSAAQGSEVSLSVLYEMMKLAELNFLADEYMEGVVEKSFSGSSLETIKTMITKLFKDHKVLASSCVDEIDSSSESGKQEETPQTPFDSMDSIKSVLLRFINTMLQHPAVVASPKSLQGRFSHELKMFLLAHVTHAEENQRFSEQLREMGSNSFGSDTTMTTHANTMGKIRQFDEPQTSFLTWVRAQSADNTSCPFSFVFYNCLLVQQYQYSPFGLPDDIRKGCGTINVTGTSARVAYLAEDVCRHLATLCRIYNDAGSLGRDIEEQNLNSLNFPEFTRVNAKDGRDGLMQEGGCVKNKMMKELLWIGEYERGCMQRALEGLEEFMGDMPRGGKLLEAVKLFISFTDLYGQIYVLKDVGTRTK